MDAIARWCVQSQRITSLQRGVSSAKRMHYLYKVCDEDSALANRSAELTRSALVLKVTAKGATCPPF